MGSSFGFYLRDTFQSQTHTEKYYTLYNTNIIQQKSLGTDMS